MDAVVVSHHSGSLLAEGVGKRGVAERLACGGWRGWAVNYVAKSRRFAMCYELMRCFHHRGWCGDHCWRRRALEDMTTLTRWPASSHQQQRQQDPRSNRDNTPDEQDHTEPNGLSVWACVRVCLYVSL